MGPERHHGSSQLSLKEDPAEHFVSQGSAEPHLNCPGGQTLPPAFSMSQDTTNLRRKEGGGPGHSEGGGPVGEWEPQLPFLLGAGQWCTCPFATCIRCPGDPGPTLTSGAAAGTGLRELGPSQSVA